MPTHPRRASILAVRYVDGRSLAERLAAGGPLEVPELVRLAAEAGAGLDALHRRGIVHRDVKPANLLLAPDGRPWSATSGWPGTAPGRC
jgi:serine/threonine protein kinase